MWENDINVQGESVMNIVPVIRKVSVGVKNKMMANIISQMGLYNMDNWYDPEEFLVLQNVIFHPIRHLLYLSRLQLFAR